jgi:hypothetical protein
MPAGRRVLESQRDVWQNFFAALKSVAKLKPV